MIQGITFDKQLFTAEAFAKFQNTFLNDNCGVIEGLDISNTTNSVTIADGWLCVKGRFLREQGGTTLNVATNGYYSLICEIDLSKENTETVFNQASFKLISGTDAYPTLTQQDIASTGTLYQYELARFKYNNTITDFADKRTYLKFDSIYSDINAQSQALITEIKNDLQNVKNGSEYVLKSDSSILQVHATNQQYEANPDGNDSYKLNFCDNDGNPNIIYQKGDNIFFDKENNGFKIGSNIKHIKLSFTFLIGFKFNNIQFTVYIYKNDEKITSYQDIRLIQDSYRNGTGYVPLNFINYIVDVAENDLISIRVDNDVKYTIGKNSYVTIERVD